MSNISKRRKEGSRTKIKVRKEGKSWHTNTSLVLSSSHALNSVGDHKEFLNRITKTLYYGQLPTLPCLSLPVTEISCEVWSAAQRGRSLRRLHADAAAGIARQACVSPCALVLALLYLERLNTCNPHYLAHAPPQDLFLISLMVGNKFLQDDGEDDEVICSEWAESGGIDLKQLKNLEMEFLNAIDWKVFVSDKSFEAGLSWLERQVATRQAQTRGFFTYSDLAAACDGSAAAELARAAAACAALALGYVAALLALLASALVVSQAWLPAPRPPAPAGLPGNASVELTVDLLAADVLAADLLTADLLAAGLLAADLRSDKRYASERLRCCAGWAHRLAAAEPLRTPGTGDLERNEIWWSQNSVWSRLYRSSLVDPMQRWLERINEYAELLGRGLSARRRLSWLDMSRLGALLATVADR